MFVPRRLELLAGYARERAVPIELPIPIDDIVEKHLKIGIEFDDTHKLFGGIVNNAFGGPEPLPR